MFANGIIGEVGGDMPDNSGNSAKYSHFSRTLLDSIERLFGAMRRHRRFTPVTQPVKVNLGSGLRVAPGWINIDGSLKTLMAGRPDFVIGLAYKFLTDNQAMSPEQFRAVLSNNIFVQHNLKYGIPLHDSSADFIFTSHTLHHFYRDEAQALLQDAFRVLKPGGTIRIAVPNLEYIFSLYQRGERERALGYFFYSSQPRNQLSRRRYQYDFELLRQMLAGAGYQKIRRCVFRQGRTPDLDQLDNLPQETLFVEADKPSSTAVSGIGEQEPLGVSAV
jgi:predicted SAM-dependent methyltransferase